MARAGKAMGRAEAVKRTLKIESLDVGELLLDPANVREHSKRNLEAITASLKRFGQQKPIVIDEQNVVVAGNGTLTAARDLGWDKIAAVRTKLGGVDRAAFAIADNRSGELAEWDFEGLSVVLAAMKDAGEEIEDLGWATYELEPLLQAEWTPPEPMGDLGDVDTTPQTRPFRVTHEQRQVMERAIEVVREAEQKPDMTEGMALEFICDEFIVADKDAAD